MRKKKWLTWLVLIVAFALLVLAGLDQRLIVRTYTLKSSKIDTPIRLVFLSDFHGCDDGNDFLQQVAQLQPDVILMPGDMFSADGDAQEELRLFRTLAAMVPTYYVTGNHEYWEYDVPQLLTQISETGVTVLNVSNAELVIKGQHINLCGVPDPYAYMDTDTSLNLATSAADQANFTVLLAHRPELVDKYVATNAFDLVVSGHAHGGQIRIPGLVNGLYAPNQGWLPQYAGGSYTVQGTTMIVSRGLSIQRQMGIPRIFNRPEVVVVEII